MEQEILTTGNKSLRVEGAYILIAYRYGHRGGHSYLVDICGGIDTASQRAEEEANERGGKYSVVVFAKHIDTGDIEEIYEARCPEHYTKNTNPMIARRDVDQMITDAIAELKFELEKVTHERDIWRNDYLKIKQERSDN